MSEDSLDDFLDDFLDREWKVLELLENGSKLGFRLLAEEVGDVDDADEALNHLAEMGAITQGPLFSITDYGRRLLKKHHEWLEMKAADPQCYLINPVRMEDLLRTDFSLLTECDIGNIDNYELNQIISVVGSASSKCEIVKITCNVWDILYKDGIKTALLVRVLDHTTLPFDAHISNIVESEDLEMKQ